MREEAISVGLWPWPVEAAYSRRTNHQFTLVVLIALFQAFRKFSKYHFSIAFSKSYKLYWTDSKVGEAEWMKM
ncbi:hypothetical protein E3V90_05520 [Streptococcus pseudopneumoniae]|nr:hypothetical protein E3V90_05520 [Streptococcus pseudopneumoniae]